MAESNALARLALAPMATLSHEAFRRCVERFGGCDEYFNEMINASSLIHQGPFEKFYTQHGDEGEKIVWQITGNSAEPMAEAASILAELPGIGIDINMGCSAPQISCTGAGISWMTKPAGQTRLLVRLVKSALENSAKDGRRAKRLSAKLRLGAEDFTDSGFFEFTNMLIDEGVQLLTLHPRTQKEKLVRHLPRYEYAEQLALRHPGIPIYINGEIKDDTSLDSALRKAPHASGAMIARAAAQKPWIFAKLKGLLNDERIDMRSVALDFIADVEKYQPPEFWRTRLQRFFSYFCLNFTFGNYFKNLMLNAADSDDSRRRVDKFFSECPDERFKAL